MGFESIQPKDSQSNFFESGLLPENMLDEVELAQLPDLLLSVGLKTGAEVTVSGVAVTISQGGVASVFNIDTKNVECELDASKSYDVFAEDNDWDDQAVRPILSAETIHSQRQELLQQALALLADPELVE